MKRFAIRCGHCNGTGLVSIPDWAKRTLAAMPSGSATAPELFERAGGGMSPTTINNRLAAMERWGLVKRERINGKSFAWSKTAAGLRVSVNAKIKRKRSATRGATDAAGFSGLGDT